jgi:hypothetical protein
VARRNDFTAAFLNGPGVGCSAKHSRSTWG